MIYYILSACGCPTYNVNLSNRVGRDLPYNDLNYISTERSIKNVASCKGKVHVAWFARDFSGNTAILYRRSADGGITWDPAVQLTIGNLDLELWVQCYGDTVVVAYEKLFSDKEIYYRYSTNGGATWSAEAVMRGGSYNQEGPSVWIGGNKLHLAWADNTPLLLTPIYYIFYNNSTNLGLSWSSNTRLDLSDSPIIVGDPTNPNILHIWFMIFNTLESKARYIRSVDGGATWSSTFDLSGGVDASGSGFWRRPVGSITAYGIYVHAVFVDDRFGNKEVLYRRSTNSGASWSGIIRLTNTPGTSWSPFILTNPLGEVRLYWVDDSDGDYEVMCKISTDNGANWSSDDRLTNNSARDVMVSLDYDPTNSRWHIVWASNETGDWEVYYTSDPCPMGNDDELGVEEKADNGNLRILRDGIVFDSDGEVKVFGWSGRTYKKVWVYKGYMLKLPKGVWFVEFKGRMYKVVIN
ncbi:MAG: sialidase family protein [candidate division WOR-3 bacterium]